MNIDIQEQTVNVGETYLTYLKILCFNCQSQLGAKYQPKKQTEEYKHEERIHPYLLFREIVDYRDLNIT